MRLTRYAPSKAMKLAAPRDADWENVITVPRTVVGARDGSLRLYPVPDMEALRGPARRFSTAQNPIQLSEPKFKVSTDDVFKRFMCFSFSVALCKCIVLGYKYLGTDRMHCIF